MSKSKKFIIALLIVALFISFFYVFSSLIDNFSFYNLKTRFFRVLSMFTVSAAIATATVIFQTIVDNRIITPSVIGIDKLFILTQTILIFLFGSTSFLILNDITNFIISTIIMVSFSAILFTWYLKHKSMSIFNFLLIAMIFSMLIGSINSFLTMIIDPDEFMFVQDSSFASFNIVNKELLIITILITIVCLIYIFKRARTLDVLFLGMDQALNLGIDFKSFSFKIFIVVAILTSVSTSLVGPMLFLGFIVVNISKQFVKTHKELIITSILISQIILVTTFWFSQSILNFMIPQTILIDLVGALYFITLVLKERND